MINLYSSDKSIHVKLRIYEPLIGVKPDVYSTD